VGCWRLSTREWEDGAEALKAVWFRPEAAACSFRCTVPRKSQEVIKWKRSENEEVLVRSLSLLGMEPRRPARARQRLRPRGVPDAELFQPARSARAERLQAGPVPPEVLNELG